MHASVLAAGRRAPRFELHATPDRKVSLAEFRGECVILAFYPADSSPVCCDQIALHDAVLPEFRKLGAELLGISVDGVWCRAAFADSRKLHFPLLADFEPEGDVTKRYGAFRSGDGSSERALFVTDGDGVAQWNHCSPVDVNPGADGILSALEAMRDGRPWR